MKAMRGWTGAVLGALLGGSAVLGQSPSLMPASSDSTPVVTITTEPLPRATPVSTPAPMLKGESTPRALPSLKGGGTLTPTGGTAPYNAFNPYNTPAEAMGMTPVASPNPFAPGTPLPAGAGLPAAEASPALTQPSPVESWLNHTGPGCCGPVGANGPISYDLYFRTGPTMPVGGGTMAQAMHTGWAMRGGARTLFFTPQGESAWLIDTNLEYAYNNGVPDKLLAFFGRPVTVSSVSRWSVGVAVGKEWYTQGPGYVMGATNAPNISYGFDAGGRWGTSHVDYNRISTLNTALRTARHYDVIGGAYGGFNLNYEMPMGGFTFILGGRLEGAMTFSQVLEGYGGTLFDVNLLLNAGVRY